MNHRLREIRQRIKKLVRRSVLRAARWLVPGRVADRFANLAALSRLSSWFACASHDFPGSRYDLYQRLLASEGLDAPIDYLEFGVYQGASLRWWSEHLSSPDARLYGFDCFEGLPEAWGSVERGRFETGRRVPQIDDTRVEFVVGLFQESLPSFLRAHPLPRRKIIHMDADLYSSTLYVLAQLAPHLRAGDVIIFDELGSIRMAQHEFRAFQDFSSAFRIATVPLDRDSFLEAAAVKIVSCPPVPNDLQPVSAPLAGE